jgi:hypothetical protein
MKVNRAEETESSSDPVLIYYAKRNKLECVFWRNKMYKDVTLCENCKHFFVNPEGIGMCQNEKGLAFPTSGDFCSKAEKTEGSREVNNSELLKRVYEQRRGG